MFAKSLFAAACLMASVSTVGLAEDQPAQIPMATLFGKYDAYLEMAKQEPPAFRPLYQIFSKKGLKGDVVFTFQHEGESKSFKANSDGFIDFRPDMALLKANPLITLNQPKEQMGINLTIGVIEASQTEYAIEALHQQVHNAWGQAKSMGGAMSMFAPKHSDVTAVFDETCPSPDWSITSGGKAIAGGKAKGRVTIKFKDKKIRKADSLSFSCAPAYFIL